MKHCVCLLFITVFIACKNNVVHIVAAKNLKPVPQVFKNANGNAFNNHQDTLYLNNTVFSGLLFALYANKDTAFIKPYLNGLEEGLCLKYYANHILEEERLYINGKKEGVHKGYWQNGNKKFEFEVSNDIYTNEFKEWLSNGLLVKHFHYKNGQEVGSQKLFYDNGKIKANYVIINGKRYGLLGTKNCKNVSDSIFNIK